MPYTLYLDLRIHLLVVLAVHTHLLVMLVRAECYHYLL